MAKQLADIIVPHSIPIEGELEIGNFSNHDSYKNFHVSSGKYFYEIYMFFDEKEKLWNFFVKQGL
jgi:hypothetical protein